MQGRRWAEGRLQGGQDVEHAKPRDVCRVNNLGPFVLSLLVPFPVQQTSPRASLEDAGVGIYAQGTATLAIENLEEAA